MPSIPSIVLIIQINSRTCKVLPGNPWNLVNIVRFPLPDLLRAVYQNSLVAPCQIPGEREMRIPSVLSQMLLLFSRYLFRGS